MKSILSNKFFGNIFFLALIFIVFFACDPTNISDDNSDTDISEETLAINKWIDGVMKEVYLWNNKISSSVNYKKEADPAELFNKMLYTEEDSWSWITDNWSSFEKELEGTPVSMGFSPGFYYKDSESNDVIIIIKFVYKGSPAYNAGLKRGDIIMTINGTTLNDKNYYDLYSGTSYTVGLGNFDSVQKTFSLNGITKSITAVSFDADPLIYYEVKEIEGREIGYLVYTDFTGGVNDAFFKSIDGAMDEFKENEVTDVIVDLRYNPGGEVGTAAYFASALAPKKVVDGEKVLLKMIYNKNVQDYFELSKKDSARLVYRFPPNSSNLNLNKVYFLTTKGTASASEVVIAGLDPYMDVVLVGDTTYGKYTGAWVLPDTENSSNWCMVPIVLKYSNASGFTNFSEGIAPDVYSRDYLLPARQFGDLNDGVLASAIELITGVPVVTTKSAQKKTVLREISPKQMELRKTLRVPRIEF